LLFATKTSNQINPLTTLPTSAAQGLRKPPLQALVPYPFQLSGPRNPGHCRTLVGTSHSIRPVCPPLACSDCLDCIPHPLHSIFNPQLPSFICSAFRSFIPPDILLAGVLGGPGTCIVPPSNLAITSIEGCKALCSW
jgi:hypothetical protein